MNYRFDPEARIELATAAAWYDEQCDGLGNEFVETVYKCSSRRADESGSISAH